MEIKKKATAQTQKKLTMWNIEFPVAKINEFPHNKVRTMHEIKMGIEFDAGEEEKTFVCMCGGSTSIALSLIEAMASDTLFMYSKNHTLSIYSHVFLLQHSNLFMESGI